MEVYLSCQLPLQALLIRVCAWSLGASRGNAGFATQNAVYRFHFAHQIWTACMITKQRVDILQLWSAMM